MKKFEQDFLTDYSDAALIEEIQRVAKLVTSGPLTRKAFNNLARVSASTVARHFGGWQKALAAADVADRYSGIAVTSKMRNQLGKQISQEEILHEIRRVAAAVGERPLTTSEFNRLSVVSVKTVRNVFGSLDRAVALAGLPSRVDAQREATRDRYLALLKSAAQKLNGTAPTLRDFDNLRLGVSAQVIRRFFDSSWTKALQAAGQQPKRTWKEPFTEKECFENLDRLWVALGRQPLYDELGRPPSQIGPKAYERIWHTFSRALKAYEKWRGQSLNLRRDTKTRAADNDSLSEELRRISSLCGSSTITQEDVSRNSNFDVRTFKRRRGGWKPALTQAGLRAAYASGCTDDELFENLMSVWEALGRTPKYRDMQTLPSRIPPTAYGRFGRSWRKALLAFLKWVESERPETSAVDAAPPPCDSVTTSGSEETTKRIPRPKEDKDHALRLPPGKTDRKRCFPPKLRHLVMRRDDFRCVFCGKQQKEGVRLEVDHVIAWADGGRTILENGQTLCNICNKGKGKLEAQTSMM